MLFGQRQSWGFTRTIWQWVHRIRPQQLTTNSPSPYECKADIKLSAEGVKKQLRKIKIDKAGGPDWIPARILRDAASELAVVLSSLFQQSYDSGTLPYAWKLANIRAIFKKGRQTDVDRLMIRTQSNG